MAYDKFVTINYETPEQAAAMAAKLNANDAGESVRAFANGRTLEVVPRNESITDLFMLFSKIGKAVASLFKRTPTVGKATASA